MRPTIFLLAVLLFLTASTPALHAPAGAQEAAAPSSDAPPPPRPLALSPMMVEIRGALDGERIELERLYDELAGATDPAAAMAIHLKIDQTKRAAERNLLQIQLRHARREGDGARVEAITDAIAAFDNPLERRQPNDRIGPHNDAQR